MPNRDEKRALRQMAAEAAWQITAPYRVRVSRALNREEKYLRGLIGNPNTGEIMRGDLEGAFHRIRTVMSHRRKKE